MQKDVNHKPCNHKAILISALFTARHFDPHSKKETTTNKSQIAKCQILDGQSNMKNVWKQRHFSLNRESSVIELLRKNLFTTLFSVCLYFSLLRVWKANAR